MHAITGITGNIGGEVARALLNAGHAVRAVIRDPRKGAVWEALGCDVSLADMNDAAALATAFKAASDVFVLLPSNFDPSPDFPETRAIVAARGGRWQRLAREKSSVSPQLAHRRSGKIC